MFLIGLLWRLARRRWARRLLLWLVVRLVRLFGWRRAVKLLFRGRGRWRLLTLGLWRAAIRLLRVGRSALILSGWTRARASRPLGRGAKGGKGSTESPRRWLRAADASQVLRLRRNLRTIFSPEVARRRDDLRRSVLAAVGVDPEWRPPSRRGIGANSGVGSSNRAEIGDRSSQ